jgi:hypothetical protein
LGGEEQRSFDPTFKGLFIAHLELLHIPAQRRYIALESCFWKINQFPGPETAVKAASMHGGGVTIELAQQPPAGY